MNKIKATLLAAAAGLAWVGGAQAATVNIGFAPGVLYNASALSNVAVSSAAMAGMTVTMCFAGAGPCDTAIWGAGATGATGTGWSFEAGNDSFANPFLISVFGRQLQSFTLYGLGARTVFDTVTDPILAAGQSPSLNSSPGSGDGRPFTLVGLQPDISGIAVSYFDKVYVGNTDYNDLYLGMQVSFTMANVAVSGFSGEFRFLSDTDQVAAGGTLNLLPPSNPNPVPLPGTLALVGAGLLGLGLTRRRRG